MASLGWIGMGRIGTEMAMRLLRAGHHLIMVYDAEASRLAPALNQGARAASCPVSSPATPSPCS